MKTKRILATISRLVLAVVFIFSGTVKAIDPLGTVYKIEDYLKAFGGFFTDLMPLASVVAACLIVVEVLLGVCLLMNVKTSWMAWLSLAFYAVMTPLTLYIALTNPVSDCGCFGDAVVLTNWQTFWKNIVLLVFVITLLFTYRTLQPTWVVPVEIAIVVGSICLTLGLMGWTILHLPLKDFRPYKIGNNIPALMEFPEDAEPDQYAITFIYEKDGKQQEFTLDNYPKNDSTWTFVDQKSVLIKKGYEPPIHDFELVTMDFEDLTYDILESEEPITLAICYDLNKTNPKQAAKLSTIMTDCYAQGQSFYIVTGSGEQDILDFCRQMQDYTQTTALWAQPESFFLSCDPVTLKTIVRANPGLITIQNGTVIAKKNVREIQ